VSIKLSIQRSYKTINRIAPEEDIYAPLNSHWLGLMLVSVSRSILDYFDRGGVSGNQEVFTSIYLGNIALNIVLAVCVILTDNIEKGSIYGSILEP